MRERDVPCWKAVDIMMISPVIQNQKQDTTSTYEHHAFFDSCDNGSTWICLHGQPQSVNSNSIEREAHVKGMPIYSNSIRLQ